MTDKIFMVHFATKPADLETVAKELGVNASLISLSPAWQPNWPADESWFNVYDTALQNGLKVVTTLWALPYKWREPDGSVDNFPEKDPINGWWDLSEAMPFFDFLNENDHYRDATFALNIIDQPFYPYGEQCKFWSAFQMEKLRRAIQIVLPEMSTYYDINDPMLYKKVNDKHDAPYADNNPCYHGRIQLTNNATDYCSISIRPFISGQKHLRADVVKHLSEQVEFRQKYANRLKYIYLLKVYRQDADQTRMPTEAEFIKHAKDAMRSNVADGFSLYTWLKWSIYQEALSDHPELFGAIKELAEDYLND